MNTDREPIIQDADMRDVIVDGEIVEGRKAIKGLEDGHIYEIVSDRYSIVNHQETISWVEELLASDPALQNYNKMIHTEDHGARMKLTYTFPELLYEVAEGDVINPQINVMNSLDRKWGYAVLVGAYRLVCSNGMVVGQKTGEYKNKHVTTLDKSEALEIVHSGLEGLKETCTTWASWRESVLPMKQAETTLKTLDLKPKEAEGLYTEAEVSTGLTLATWLEAMKNYKTQVVQQMTWWVFFNIITQYITHRVASVSRQMTLNNKLRLAMYGF